MLTTGVDDRPAAVALLDRAGITVCGSTQDGVRTTIAVLVPLTARALDRDEQAAVARSVNDALRGLDAAIVVQTPPRRRPVRRLRRFSTPHKRDVWANDTDLAFVVAGRRVSHDDDTAALLSSLPVVGVVTVVGAILTAFAITAGWVPGQTERPASLWGWVWPMAIFAVVSVLVGAALNLVLRRRWRPSADGGGRHMGLIGTLRSWLVGGLLVGFVYVYGALSSIETATILLGVTGALGVVWLADHALRSRGPRAVQALARFLVAPTAIVVAVVHIRATVWAEGLGIGNGTLPPVVKPFLIGLRDGLGELVLVLLVTVVLTRVVVWLAPESRSMVAAAAALAVFTVAGPWVVRPYDDARAVLAGATFAPSAPGLVQRVCLEGAGAGDGDGGDLVEATFVGETASSYALLLGGVDGVTFVPRGSVSLRYPRNGRGCDEGL
ncbi:hypothetical protein [Solicola sp. PLA-1-18]|uniref:hypothetical protein n=1 Tax=Solicola sp. PLA-1-18 TaxID=3380532 RepID=UPI003B7E1030